MKTFLKFLFILLSLPSLSFAQINFNQYICAASTGEVAWSYKDTPEHYLAIRSIQVIVEKHALNLVSGSLNGKSIESSNPKIIVKEGESIQGNIQFAASNHYKNPNAIMPFAWTPSWGDHQTSYKQISGSVPHGTTTTFDVPINITAPSEYGIYYLWFIMSPRYSTAEMMSCDQPQVWNDDDDIADMDFDEFVSATIAGEVKGTYKDISEHYLAIRSIQIIVEKHALNLVSGTLNGKYIDASNPKIMVAEGQSIQGSIQFAASNFYKNPGAIMPFAWTASWGDHQVSYRQISGWVPHGTTTTYDVPIDIIAPSEYGVYYLWFVMSPRYNTAEMMSCDRPQVWNDGDDIADMKFEEYVTASSTGEVLGFYKDAAEHYLAIRSIQVVVGKHALDLISGTLNSVSISTFNPKIMVQEGQSIQGTVQFAATNTYKNPGAIMPFAWTPSWGDHQASYQQISGWVPHGTTTTYDVPINITAPSEYGVYYLWFVMSPRYNAAEMMSCDRPEVWNDSDDIADMGFFKKPDCSTFVIPLFSKPEVYSLSQNYPNPFNPVTKINYSIPEPGHVEISIFNSLGQSVKTLVSEYQTAGHHITNWDATNNLGNKVVSGIYYYMIKAEGFTQIKKMTLIK